MSIRTLDGAYVAPFSMLVKARPVGSDNRRLVEIQASVEKEDSEGDLILQKALLGSKDKFIKAGHIDIDHLSELGHQYGIPDPNSWIVGRPLDVWAGPNKETWVLAEINKSFDGSFNPEKSKSDAIWKSLTDTPPTLWRSSVFGYMGGDTEDCRTNTCDSGPARFLVKSFDWCSLAFTRSPVNDGIANPARVVMAKSFVAQQMALAKAGRSSLDGILGLDPAIIMEAPKAAGWIENPARPSMNDVKEAFETGATSGGLKDSPSMPILKALFIAKGYTPADAELCAYAGMYHFICRKAEDMILARATGKQGAQPPIIYGPGNESLDDRPEKTGKRGQA